MRILGIETSCDETAAAIVKDGTKILSNIVASSQELHQKTGGIIPEVAAREQIRCIIPVIEEALKEGCGWVMGSEFSCKDGDEGKREESIPVTHPKPTTHNSSSPPIDALAVTIGPGLIGSLLVGVETAKTLACVWKKPIVPVNHLVAHIYANWFSSPSPFIPNSQLTTHPHPQFPAIALVVSGGHTDLVLMKDHGKIKWLGGTRDDAAGECFDKAARVLELGYPGGPVITAAAAKYRYQVSSIKYKVKLPRPMIETNDFDFSFSGLKTAVIREIKKIYPHNPSQTHNSQPIPTSLLAHEIQEAITDVLVEKTIRAAEKYKVKSILLAGGVAANQRLREKILRYEDIKIFIPEPRLCTDNAAYVSSFAYFNFKPTPWQKIKVEPGLSITSEV